MNKKVQNYSSEYTKLYPLTLSIINKKIGNRDAAEDIAQELFIKMYNKFDDIDSCKKWMYEAIRFELLNYLKKKQVESNNINIMLNDASFSFVNGFRESRIIINNIINDENLYEDDNDSIIFEMIAVLGYTISKTAQILSMPRHKVKYRYNKIKDLILNELTKIGIKNLKDLL